MTRTLSILFVALALLAVPAVAAAGTRDHLAGAKLQSATGSLTITETRCPPGSATNCGKARLDETFATGPEPKARPVPGRTGFPRGFRITGKGAGQCNVESPTTTVAGPDGSMQFLGSAARITPGKFADTRVAMASGKRSIRVAWLEPLAPGITCSYFGEPGTELALSAAQELPSPIISARVLKRSRFSITITASREWSEQAADGTTVNGRASWRLRLTYRR